MKRSDIRNAYDLMTPSRSQKDKMLEAILTHPVKGKNSKGRYEQRQEETYRVSWTAIAAAVLCLVIGGFALSRLSPPGVVQMNSGAVDWLLESDFYRAGLEWHAYLGDSDIAPAESDGITSPYLEYYCQSSEDIAKLDELCERYSLALLPPCLTEDFSQFVQDAGLEEMFYPIEGVSHENDRGAYQKKGYFSYEGSTTMEYEDSPWLYPVDYGYFHFPKDYFPRVLWRYGDLTSYENWEYTSTHGQSLSLFVTEDEGLILADREDDFVLVIIKSLRVGDIVYGEQTMSREAVEAFAETFDYSLTPRKAWLPEGYEYILTKYQAGVDNGWTAKEYMNNDLSILPAYLQNPEDLGYCLLDLDGNGYEELLVGTDNVIFDLFTYNDEVGPLHLLCAGQMNPYVLCKNNIIKQTSGIGMETEETYFLRLSGGMDLVIERSLLHTDDGWESGSQWSETEVVSQEEAMKILDSYQEISIDYQPFIELPQQPTESTFVDSSYADILFKYAIAVRENWSEEKCAVELISSACLEKPEDLGYFLLDISGDGVEELFIGNGEVFYDMYGMGSEQKPFHMLYTFENENDPFILCGDGIIKRTTYGGAGEIYHIFYRMEDSATLSPVRTVYYDPNAKDGPWFHGVTDTSAEPVSADQAQTVLDSYKPMTVEVTRFARETDAIVLSYAEVLLLYGKAVQENWDLETCQNNGISYLTAFLEDIRDIGYTCIDLDGNGYVELIVSDGELIYDLYTRQNDGVIRLLFSGERTRYYLCDNNVLAYEGSSGAASSIYSYSVVAGGELKHIESVSFNATVDAENPWFHNDGLSDALYPISETEARKIIDGYRKVTIETRDILRETKS